MQNGICGLHHNGKKKGKKKKKGFKKKKKKKKIFDVSQYFCKNRNKNILKGLLKGTNGRQKTYEIFHVYCVFYSGFMCQTTVIFGITKDGSLVLTTLAS